MKGQPFVISAPSGAGKTTVVQALMERVDGLDYSVSHTTRKPRKGERNGIDYYFIDTATFEKMIENGDFIEWAKVYTDLYGTSVAGIDRLLSEGKDVLLDLDVQGAQGIREHYRDSILIYLLPPSIRTLRTRLMERNTDDDAVIRKRMESVECDIKNCLLYDYIIINDELDRAVYEAESIIISERCRTGRRIPLVQSNFNISFS